VLVDTGVIGALLVATLGSLYSISA